MKIIKFVGKQQELYLLLMPQRFHGLHSHLGVPVEEPLGEVPVGGPGAPVAGGVPSDDRVPTAVKPVDLFDMGKKK